MAHPASSRPQTSERDDRAIFLSITVALAYLLFQLIAAVSFMQLDGACMYTFWANSPVWWQDPYWLVVAIVGGLGALATMLIASGVRQRQPVAAIGGAVAFSFLLLWAYGLNGMWKAMEYERGNLSAESWFRDRQQVSFALSLGGYHECEDAT